jgi:AcrR family transcriptional regulator
MPRPPGRRNSDYAESREELVKRLRERLSAPDGAAASLRELAAASGVSVPTLKHYFGDRDGAVAAVLRQQHLDGMEHMRFLAAGPLGPLGPSLRAVLEYTVRGFQQSRLGRVFAVGMSAGFGHPALGPAYLAEILEPTLQAMEARLQRHVDVGDLRPVDVRYAALSLLAPPLLALLHQHELGGETYRRLVMSAFLDQHVAGFVAAYGTAPDTASGQAPSGPRESGQSAVPGAPGDARVPAAYAGFAAPASASRDADGGTPSVLPISGATPHAPGRGSPEPAPRTAAPPDEESAPGSGRPRGRAGRRGRG